MSNELLYNFFSCFFILVFGADFVLLTVLMTLADRPLLVTLTNQRVLWAGLGVTINQLININYNIKMFYCWTRGVLSSPWRPLSPLSVSTSRLSSLNTGPGLDQNYLWCHKSFWLARLWQQNCSIKKLKHSTAGTRRRRQFGPDQHVQLHYSKMNYNSRLYQQCD